MQWLRLYHEARVDAKLRSLSDAQFRVWFQLLCLASEQPRRGTITDLSDELLAIYVAGGDVALLEATLDRLEALKIVTLGGPASRSVTGVTCNESNEIGRYITVTNFEKRNGVRVTCNAMTSAERVRKYRERKKLERNGTLKRDETLVQHGRNSRATDSDSETDTEYPPTPPPGNGGGGEAPRVVSDEHRETVELARSLVGDDFAGIVTAAGRDIAGTLGGRWDCYRAAIRGLARSSTAKDNPHGWCLKVARRFMAEGIPPEPTRGRGPRATDPYSKILAEMDDE